MSRSEIPIRLYRRLVAMRAETLAAIASAVAAAASALAAIYALTLLSHQEDIARSQVQATYLSNLYSKQVISFSELETALAEFYEQTDILRLSQGPLDIGNFQSELKTNMEKYRKARFTLVRKTNEMLLITPESFSRLVDEVSSVTNDILHRADAFTRTDHPTQQMLDAFNEEMREGFGRLDSWYNQVPKCLRSIFIQGGAITKERLASCHFSADLTTSVPDPIFPKWMPPPQ